VRRRRLGLRWRITIVFLGGALAVSALLAGSTYALADRYLFDQRIESATEQSFSSVRFARRYLLEADVSLGELVTLVEARGTFEVIILKDEQWFPSSVSISKLSVPERLRRRVLRGDVGYELVGDHRLVFGSPIPETGLTAFFFYSTQDITDALSVLRGALLLLTVGAAALAALVGTRISRRVLHPVRQASEAARRVAEGLLETRLPVEDRDELGTLAHSFNEMAAALEERIAHERRFVGDVSHELRTPLTTLRTSTDYLLERVQTHDASAQRAAELLAADLLYLQRLVNDLLDISRVEAGRVELSLERLNLADLVREVVARRTRNGKRVALRIEAPGAELVTVGDKQRLERVIGNLIDNALTHGRGQDVRVEVTAEPDALVLEVADRGPGIPAAAAPRIFERFYKADPARAREDGFGSGLGLAIARDNARLHGGEIEVETGRAEGARFVFRLPRREEEPAR